MHPKPDTLDLVPDAHAVASAMQWLEEIAEREGWSPKLTFGLTLSLDEALTNIVSYAFDDPTLSGSPARVSLSCRQQAEWILLEIIDNGRPYDPTKTPPPGLAATIEEAAIGGHGVRLMQHYLHELRYARDDNNNHLTLVVRAL